MKCLVQRGTCRAQRPSARTSAGTHACLPSCVASNSSAGTLLVVLALHTWRQAVSAAGQGARMWASSSKASRGAACPCSQVNLSGRVDACK